MKSRREAFLAVSGWLLVLALMWSIFGYQQMLRLWNIPAMSPCFADLRVITHGADAVAQGINPMLNNATDPWGRSLNYPRLWQCIYYFGINKSDTIWLGFAIILLFLVGIVMILPNASNRTILLVLVVITSPAVLLGMERANIDLFIFFLLSLSIIISRKYLFASVCVISFATALKLFPLFAVSLLLKLEKKPFIAYCCGFFALTISYLFISWSDLRLISQATPRATDLSYGMNVGWMHMQKLNPSLGLLLHFIAITTIIASVFLFFLGCKSEASNNTVKNDANSISLDSFRVGAAIYLGTFLLGNNYDYRLSFLILCIPQLSNWMNSCNLKIRWYSITALCSVLLSVWYLFFSRGWGVLSSKLSHWISLPELFPWFLDELYNWLIFITIAYLFSITLPCWIKKSILCFTKK